ncbi:MAG TPA: hypothetical protein VNL77_03240 [Roseiflexaceae bacterium]|nr:hypothetical protein [Roseiflexaceae bacterium]
MRAFLLLLVLIAAALPAAPAVAAPVPEPPLLPGAPAPRLRGELAMRTYSLDLYRLRGSLDARTVQALGLLAEQAIVSNTLEIGSGLAGRVAVRFEPPQRGPCALRGVTYSAERTIRLFYAPDADPERVLAVLAHELFHQQQRDYYGERAHRRADTILLEGMATWGTRAYFRGPDGEPGYRRRVREALAVGQLQPLTTSLERDCRTTTRNVLYDQWASFVEFLITTGGRERFDALYRDSRGRPAGSANYRGVYGKTLAQLEADWVAWLKSGSRFISRA